MIDRYTKAVLTVIAGCLVWLCALGIGPTASAQGVAMRQIPNAPIQPVVIVGTGTLDQQGMVTIHFGRPADGGSPKTDPTLPVMLPYTAGKPLPVALPYSPSSPMPSQLFYTSAAPLPDRNRSGEEIRDVGAAARERGRRAAQGQTGSRTALNRLLQDMSFRHEWADAG
jgi:hypothetical protein